jgi:hypothetical protein
MPAKSPLRKSRQGFPRRLCRCVAFAYRSSASSVFEHSRAASPLDARSVASVSGPTIPDASDAVTSTDADQASGPALLMADFIAPGAARSELGVRSWISIPLGR